MVDIMVRNELIPKKNIGLIFIIYVKILLLDNL